MRLLLAAAQAEGETNTTQAAVISVGDLSVPLASFERSLRAANKPPKTLKTYGGRERHLKDGEPAAAEDPLAAAPRDN